MRVELAPGESVTVCFSGNIGEVTVVYKQDGLSVFANPIDQFGRDGEIYRDEWGDPEHFDIETYPVIGRVSDDWVKQLWDW